jgi:hypothetical protein
MITWLKHTRLGKLLHRAKKRSKLFGRINCLETTDNLIAQIKPVNFRHNLKQKSTVMAFRENTRTCFHEISASQNVRQAS